VITVRLPSALRADSGGVAAVELPAHDGATLGDVLRALFEAHPLLRRRVLDDAGEVRRFVNIYVGDDEVGHAVGLGAAVRDGQVVHILPSVAGGA